MTADGGMNPDVETWDEARIALGRVADLIREKLGSYTEPGWNETVTLSGPPGGAELPPDPGGRPRHAREPHPR